MSLSRHLPAESSPGNRFSCLQTAEWKPACTAAEPFSACPGSPRCLVRT